jgi:hypothetical protein
MEKENPVGGVMPVNNRSTNLRMAPLMVRRGEGNTSMREERISDGNSAAYRSYACFNFPVKIIKSKSRVNVTEVFQKYNGPFASMANIVGSNFVEKQT